MKDSSKLKITIERDSVNQEISWSVKDSAMHLSIKTYLQNLNKDILTYRFSGSLSLIEQIPIIDTLLYTIFNDSSVENTFRTLTWGRLNDHKNHDYTLAKRLSLIAYRSKRWNLSKGMPYTGNANNFVIDNAKNFAPEIDSLLTKYNYKVKSISVEKVLVGYAEELPFWDELKESVNPRDRLPFDCQLWFNFTPVK